MPAKSSHLVRAALALGLVLLLTGCSVSDMISFFHLSSLVTFFTAGPVAEYERNLMLFVFVVMLFVLVPVVGFTFYFAYKYRASNRKATHLPNWHHSTFLEGFLWGGPVVIVLILGATTIITTHDMDPYKPIESRNKPLQVEAIAMDWKWLFIYPHYDVASVNELVMPVDTPVEIHLTSATVMNAFMIPRLGSQIMAMSGMQTKLNLMATQTGSYFGKNYQYSGDGFVGMHFQAKSMRQKGFYEWITRAESADNKLDIDAYKKLVMPSQKVPVSYYSTVKPGLFQHIIDEFNSSDGNAYHAGHVAETSH